MKNLYWIVQSVVIILLYCISLHYVFTFLKNWTSIVFIPISLITGFGFVVLFAILCTYIFRNYHYLECDLFD